MMDESDPRPDVYGPAECARALGVSGARFRVLKARPDFPAARELEIGHVWDGAEIRAYAIQRKPKGRGRFAGRPVLDGLRAWRRTGVLAEAAREVGVDPATLTRWLKAARAHIPRHG